MSKDPYQILGVDRKASEAEIKAAYRKLAKKHHPDLNPDKTNTQFADISKAYEILSDKKKRAAFDQNEIDLEGQPQQQQHYYRDFAHGPQGARYYHSTESDFSAEDMEDLLGAFFARGKTSSASSFHRPSLDIHYTLEIDFIEAAIGTQKRVVMPDNRTLDIKIPAGIEDGQQLRLKGQGRALNPQTPPGDIYVKIHIRPHPLFTRKGQDIYIELPIGIHESVLGKKIRVPTIHGTIEMAIPKGADSNTTLRIKGKGIKGGDQYVTLKLVMPHSIDTELERTIQHWAEQHAYNPRKMESME